MELGLFEDLLVLLEERSFTRAALRRHVTQPAFSRRIRLLEDWLGVKIVDRSSKPIKVLPAGEALEDTARDLVNRVYAIRSNLQANTDKQDRVDFVVQHTLAISLFPRLIRHIKKHLPNTAYRVSPENNDACETPFLKGGHYLIAYETPFRQFNFPSSQIRRLWFGSEKMLPVVSQQLVDEYGGTEALLADVLPLLMYAQGGFMAEALTNSCLPGVIRQHRTEVICESAFSASLKEMVLADMGIAWLASDMLRDEINRGQLVSLESSLGSVELDIVLFQRIDHLSDEAQKLFELLQLISKSPEGINQL